MGGLGQIASFARWPHRVRHWYGMFAGTSYYHQPQKLGRVFVPGELKGYFNDLTGKTNWNGASDARGLPESKLSNGGTTHFPILLCQKALGHWDLWLLRSHPEHRDHFLNIAHWLLDTQDAAGGWDTWKALGQPDQYKYSAMTQGEAISVLMRAFELTEDPRFGSACHAAVMLMQKPVQNGGVSWYEHQDVYLEEFPSGTRDTVLNGWIFALFGLHDYLLRFSEPAVETFFSQCRASLVRGLSQFEAGYWSYYSSGTRRLASPFYHRLHLSQLEALRRTFTEPEFSRVQERWSAYERNGLFKSAAVVLKGLQKLREPDEVAIIG